MRQKKQQKIPVQEKEILIGELAREIYDTLVLEPIAKRKCDTKEKEIKRTDRYLLILINNYLEKGLNKEA